MKPDSSHDLFDDLIAAALYGDLTPEERTQFEARINTDPAARAAYQDAKLMHDLLEKTHQNAQPDPDFERRMVSGVRRKLEQEEHRETAWESLLVLGKTARRFMVIRRPRWTEAVIVLGIIFLLYGIALGPITNGIKQSKGNAAMQQARMEAMKEREVAMDQPPTGKDLKKVIENQGINYVEAAQKGVGLSGYVDTNYTQQFAGKREITNQVVVADGQTVTKSQVMARADASNGDAIDVSGAVPSATTVGAFNTPSAPAMPAPMQAPVAKPTDIIFPQGQQQLADKAMLASGIPLPPGARAKTSMDNMTSSPSASSTIASATTPAVDNRKLIRNAQLDLEVKSFQGAVDQITALTKDAGGYVDTSNSQKGGNGKLQGTIVVKVLPQNLDAFLAKLRDVGQIENQSVSTDDVTKAYFDTQARLDNSRRMETQLQELLKRDNGKVSDLLQVERELGRVRGDIEQMQGQLKLYDFQVQYATVTMQVKEKDLNEAAAYLLKEQDDFSLFSTNVEETFQKARKLADDVKAQVLVANLNHASGSDVSADLTVMVAPDQIDSFLAQVRELGRVANFTRQTQRVAKDGGNSDNPADETKTEKDKVQVHLSIRSDDESRKQVALTVVTATVDQALDQAKTTSVSNGAEIINSSLNRTPQGQTNAQLSIRVPGKNYQALLDAFRALGRPASFSIQRDDNSGFGAASDDAPVIISLSLTDNDTPMQVTEMLVKASDVDNQAQQLKKDAAAAGVQVTDSIFKRQANGMEYALLTFRLPMGKYPAFLESLKKVGQVETLTVQRQDRPDQTRPDDSAPVEITLRLHNLGDLVAPNNGLWATLRQTFSEGATALFTSVKTIGVLIAFIAPWLLAIVIFAWVGRRIYVWKKK